jgi:hypothetical protein
MILSLHCFSLFYFIFPTSITKLLDILDKLDNLDIIQDRLILYVLIDFVNSFSSITNWYLLYDSLLVLFLCITLLFPVSIALPNIWTFLTNLIIPSTGFATFYHSFMQNKVAFDFPVVDWILIESFLEQAPNYKLFLPTVPSF